MEPYRVVTMGRRWYLLAHDSGKDDWRSFRLDRVDADTVHATTFRFTPRPAPDPVEYVRRSVLRSPGSCDPGRGARPAPVRERA